MCQKGKLALTDRSWWREWSRGNPGQLKHLAEHSQKSNHGGQVIAIMNFWKQKRIPVEHKPPTYLWATKCLNYASAKKRIKHWQRQAQNSTYSKLPRWLKAHIKHIDSIRQTAQGSTQTSSSHRVCSEDWSCRHLLWWEPPSIPPSQQLLAKDRI